MSIASDLYDLYLIDKQVRGLSRGLDAASRHLESQKAQLARLETELAELADQVRHAEAHAANSENEANTIEARIGRLREKMNSATSNKEYSALLVEVNTIKIDQGKAEEVALEHLTHADTLRNEKTELETAIAEQKKVCEHAETQLEARRADVGDSLEQMKEKRRIASEAVPASILTVFERLSAATEGEALAEVKRDDPRSHDFHCDGCYMSLPIERVNLLATTDNLVHCPSCSRVLYLASETRQTISNS